MRPNNQVGIVLGNYAYFLGGKVGEKNIRGKLEEKPAGKRQRRWRMKRRLSRIRRKYNQQKFTIPRNPVRFSFWSNVKVCIFFRNSVITRLVGSTSTKLAKCLGILHWSYSLKPKLQNWGLHRSKVRHLLHINLDGTVPRNPIQIIINMTQL